MNTSVKYPNYAILLLIFMAVSCKDKSAEPDCGCDSPATSTINNIPASYLGGNRLTLHLKHSNDVSYEEVYELCDSPDTLTITPDVHHPNYRISGTVKKVCFYGPTFAIQPPLLKITKIRKTL